MTSGRPLCHGVGLGGQMKQGVRDILRDGGAVLAACCAGAMVGARVPSEAGALTGAWLPAGVSIALLTHRGLVLAPFVALGTFAGTWVALGSAPLASLVALGATLEASGAAFLLRGPLAFTPSFPRRRDAVMFVIASCVGASVGAACGATAFALAHETASPLPALGVWWMTDLASALVYGPAVLAWRVELDAPPPRRKRAFLLPLGLLTSLLVVLAPIYADARDGYPMLVLPFAIAVLLPIEVGLRPAATCGVIACSLTIVASALGHGPLVDAEPMRAFTLLWTGVSVPATAVLLLAGVFSERLRVTAARDASELRFRSAFDHAPLGMAILGFDGRLELVNARLAEILEADPATLADVPVARFIEPGTRARLARPLLEMQKENKPFVEAGVEIRTSSGAFRTCDVRITLLREGSNPHSFILQLEDVTERERERARRDNLEKQLVHAQRMDSIGRLAGGVAHDFNNMLQAVLGNVDLARGAAKRGRDVDDHLERATEAGTRAAQLTQQLLTFSRRKAAAMTTIDLVATVEGVAALVRRLIPQTVAIEVRKPPEPVYVRGDAGQLEQVIMNLAVNARDAMPAGGSLEIGVELVGGREAGGLARLAVRDTGEGIATEALDRIFEPFFTTKPVGKGTGLGLSVVYGIVTSHRGTIEVDTSPGGGTTFSVTLPSTDPPKRKRTKRDVDRQSEPGVERVLVVEDEEMVRRVVCAILEEAGYVVVTASNGLEALHVLDAESETVDLVFLDVVMPVLGGRATYERLRVKHPDVPVLFTSGHADDDFGPEFLQKERLEILRKPYDRKTLLAVVRARLDGSRTRESNPSLAGW